MCFVEESLLSPVTPNWKEVTSCHPVFLVSFSWYQSIFWVSVTSQHLEFWVRSICPMQSFFSAQITAGMTWPVWRKRFLAQSCLCCLSTQRKKWFRGPTTPPLDWRQEFSPGLQRTRCCNCVFSMQFILKIMIEIIACHWLQFIGPTKEPTNNLLLHISVSDTESKKTHPRDPRAQEIIFNCENQLLAYYWLCVQILPAGIFLEPTVWLRTWRQAPASLTTITLALWRCHLEDIRIQVRCLWVNMFTIQVQFCLVFYCGNWPKFLARG